MMEENWPYGTQNKISEFLPQWRDGAKFGNKNFS